ncbi:MAG: ABC transporter permease [Actinomycetota bacterium]|nr:ABC transporter permease [Actinomycetota bacterium]
MDGIGNWLTFMNDRRDDVIDKVIEHAMLVFWVMLAATAFAVLVGILIRDRPNARGVAASVGSALQGVTLGTAGVFLVIPSLALFAIFIPIVGIGFWPPFIALFMYALLPIMRNTVTGLAGVDQAVLESARGMGLNARQRLFKVQLPLAWPVILTGIRVSTLLTTGIAAIAVLVGGPGLGFYINDGLTRYPFPNSVESMWTGMALTVILALLFDLVFVFLRRVTLSKGLRL